MMNRCPNCMRVLEGSSCPSCGFPQINAAVSVRGALDCHTILDKRYEIGNPLGSNAQSIAYIAFDNHRQEPVILLEFFPKQVAVRSEQLVTLRGRNDLYADACRRFLTSKVTQPLRLIETFSANNTGYRVYKPQSSVYAVEAELLLDEPIFFRDEMNQPIMSINALHIPPMPKQRSWTLSRKLTLMQKRRKTRRIIAGSAAMLVLALTGAFVWDTLREHDVIVQVRTIAPVTEASLGELALPQATPDSEGMVTYQEKLRKGAYAFTAKNEQGLSQRETLNVSGPTTWIVAIPTPSPTPVPPIKLEDREWIYEEDGQYYVVGKTFNEEKDAKPDQATEMYKVHLYNTAKLTDSAPCEILLCRNGASRALTWKNGAIDFAVTAGTYELMLRIEDQPILFKKLEVSKDEEVQIDTDALAFYRENAKELKENKQLYYVGDHANLPMISVDAAGLNAWCEHYPELFDAYKQHSISLQVDPRLSENVKFELNGLPWVPGQDVTMNDAVTALKVDLIVDGYTDAESLSIDFAAPIIIGSSLADKMDADWEGVKGLVEVGDETYLYYDSGELKPANEEELDRLNKASKLMSKFSGCDRSKLVDVSVELHDWVRQDAVRSVEINGVPLKQEEDGYRVALTPGEYEFTVHFSNDTAPAVSTKKIPDGQSNVTIKLLTDGIDDAMLFTKKLRDSKVDGMIQTRDGFVLLPVQNAKALENVSVQDVLDRASTYSGIFDDQWELCDTELSIDNRVKPDVVESILIEDQPLNLLEQNVVDLQKATKKTYNITVTLKDGTEEESSFTVTALPEENRLVLLKDWVDEKIDQLPYWGLTEESLTPIINVPALTEETLQECCQNAVVHKLTLMVESEYGYALPLKLRHVQSGQELELGTASTESPALIVHLSEGEYKLIATYEGEEYSIWLKYIDQDKAEQLTDYDFRDLVLILTTPEPTNTPKPKHHSNTKKPSRPTKTPKPTATATVSPTPDATATTSPSVDVPNTEKPSADVPDTEKPSTDVPDTESPSVDVPNTEKPSADVPDTEKPSPDVPDTEKPSADVSDTEKPSTDATETPETIPNASPTSVPTGHSSENWFSIFFTGLLKILKKSHPSHSPHYSDER